MFKKIVSLILSFAMILPMGIEGFAAEKTKVILNEVFDDYALNSVPGGIGVYGVDARCVETEKNNKSLYAKAWGIPVSITMPVETEETKLVYSFDIKIKGDVSGSILKLSNSTSLLKYYPNGYINLEDGYHVGGYNCGKWNSFDVAIDYDNLTYNVYLNGEHKVKNRKFFSTPTRSNSLDFKFSSESSAEVFLDNVRVYTGLDIQNDAFFPYKAPSQEKVDFTLTTSKPENNAVIINSLSTAGLEDIILASKENALPSFKALDDSEYKYLNFTQTGTYDCYADLPVDMKNTQQFIYQADVYVESLETGEIILGRAIGSSYSNIAHIKAGGVLKAGTGTNTTVGQVPFKKWTNIAVAIDLVSGTADYYVNKSLVSSGIPLHNGGVLPQSIRLGFTSQKLGGRNEFYINRIKVYEGLTLRELDESSLVVPKEGELISVGEKDSIAVDIMADDTVFMTTSPYYFTNGVKTKYPTDSSVYLNNDGIVMVDYELLNSSLNAGITKSQNSIKCNGKTVNIGSSAIIGGGNLSAEVTETGGKIYLPVGSFAKEILKKNIYEDDRGYVLISDKERLYKNSDVSTDNKEESDYIFRYMHYDRPTGDELYNALTETSYKTHPRLFIRKEDISGLKNKIDTNADLKKALSELLVKCETILNQPVTERVVPDGLRIFGSCETVKHIIEDLSVAYLVTGEERYAERMWDEMKNALEWEDWNLTIHHLDSGELVPGMALGYDVLYDYLTDEQKEYFRQKVKEQYFDFIVGVYTGDSTFKGNEFRMTTSNWGAVLSTAMLMMSVTLMDEESADSEFTKECKFVAENALKSLEFPLGTLFPDGAVDEGVGYWGYYGMHLSWCVRLMQNVFGNDYGLLSSPGLKFGPDFVLYMQTANGCFNYAASGSSGNELIPEVFLISDLYKDYEQSEVVNNYRKLLGLSLGARGILWYQPTDLEVDIDNYPLEHYFTGQQIVTMRSSWKDDQSAYVGIVGGLAETFFEKGSFIFENRGTRWFTDFGKGNQNLPNNGWYGVNGYKLFIKRAEGHNCLVINPSAENPGQVPGSVAKIIKQTSKPKGAITVIDLTETYGYDVKSYQRGYYLGENRNTLIVQDELELIEPNSTINWFLHTPGDVTIDADGKGAVVEIKGKKLKIDIICDAAQWELSVREPVSVFPENSVEGEYSRDGYCNLALIGKASGTLNISAKFTMEEDLSSMSEHSLIPISKWTIPDGELEYKPLASSLSTNGISVENFNPEKKEYIVNAFEGDEPPVISATSSEGVVSIKQPSTIKDYGEVIVKAPSGLQSSYRVYFKVSIASTDGIPDGDPIPGFPTNAGFANIKDIYANHNPQEANPDKNAADGDLTTRWASDKDGAYLETDLGDITDISGIAMCFASGDVRNYKYDIYVSDNKENYTLVYSGKSTGQTNEWEFLPLHIRARYIRYVGHGHMTGEWNSINEFRPCVNK